MLNYAYNIPVHRCAKLTLFSFILSTPTHGQFITSAVRLPPDIRNDNSSKTYRIRLIRKPSELHKPAWKSGKAEQERYEWNAYSKARFETQYAPGDYDFVKWTPLNKSATDCLAAENYSKLVARSNPSYRGMSVGLKTVKIPQDNGSSIVNIILTTKAIRPIVSHEDSSIGSHEDRLYISDVFPTTRKASDEHKIPPK